MYCGHTFYLLSFRGTKARSSALCYHPLPVMRLQELAEWRSLNIQALLEYISNSFYYKNLSDSNRLSSSAIEENHRKGCNVCLRKNKQRRGLCHFPEERVPKTLSMSIRNSESCFYTQDMYFLSHWLKVGR